MTKQEAERLQEYINEHNAANVKLIQATDTYVESKKRLEEYLTSLQKPKRVRKPKEEKKENIENA